jgi:YHS domain-containing protein
MKEKYMRHSRFAAVVAVSILATMAAFAGDDKVSAKLLKQAKCPVSGEAVKDSATADYMGHKVYFCCSRCEGKFKENADEYTAKAIEQLNLLYPVAIQVTCPISGEPIDPDVTADTQFGKIAFCCNKCKAKWNDDSDPYCEKLQNCYTYQTHCPVMGGVINPTVSGKVGSRSVYYCCPGCDKKVQEDSAKYLAIVDKEIAANKAEFEKRHAKLAMLEGAKKKMDKVELHP